MSYEPLPMEPTPEEQKAINSLHRLAKKWPDTLWLYSAAGALCVMRKNENGGHAETPGGGIDPHYELDHIAIDNSGGDW